MTEPKERWRPAVGYETLYSVSDYGQVISRDRRVPHPRWPGYTSLIKGRLLKPYLLADGRQRVFLYSGDGPGRPFYIHTLVAAAFIGPRPEGLNICHNDGDPSNNYVGNLRYDTQGSNMLDRVLHGTHPNAAKTHCPQGHPYDDENTLREGNGRTRRCGICVRNAANAKTAARRAERISNALGPRAGEFLTTGEVASLLGVSSRTILRRIGLGALPARQVEGVSGYFIDPLDLESVAA